MEIRQDTHSFHHSCARVRCFMLGLGNDSWALGNGERTPLPGLQLRLPVLGVCCLDLGVMENHQYDNYRHRHPGSGEPE